MSEDNKNAPRELVELDNSIVDGPNTANDFMWLGGTNLPNHSASVAGHPRFVTHAVTKLMMFRNKQDAFRCAAWLVTMADIHLPDDKDAVFTFEEIRQAIRNT